MQLWTRSPEGERWVHGFTSLSTDLIVAEGEDWRWSPDKPGVELKALPDAPTPATTEVERLRQMKGLAKRFSAHQSSQDSRSKLRLVTEPVHRYSSQKSGVLDGAVFAICHAMDPEVILLIEAPSDGSSRPVWHYGLARLTMAEFHVSFDSREVWQQPRAPRVTTRDPYWLFVKEYAEEQD
jgi:hypothetical protein